MKNKLKRLVARCLRIPGVVLLMKAGILLVVPRHRLGVQAVVLNKNNQVLLLEHVFHPFAPWGLPGGWLKRREHPGEAIIRELYEETGLQGRLGPPLHLEQVPFPQQLTLAFLVQVETGRLTLSGEILSARWFDLDDLPDGMYAFNYQAIQAAQSLLAADLVFAEMTLRST